MKKGIAVETLVKFSICLIVLGICTYLIYRYVFGSGLSERECAARMTAWCAQCQIAKFSGGTKMGNALAKCAYDYGYIDSNNPNQLCDGLEEKCKAFIPST
ncbi:MAG: hypothetical protein QMD36_01325 [Candidatus Aenigmarchaeota archaeon]|nr:hypothetical protein [Candidatus Aenigmarchaeota archaeon]